jgi:hypothetical protein
MESPCEETRDIQDMLRKDLVTVARSRVYCWEEKARERVETAEKALRSHKQERER